MAKQTKVTQRQKELADFQRSVSQYRDLIAGKKELGLDFNLVGSLARLSVIFTTAASQKGKNWCQVACRLGNPDPADCAVISDALTQMQSAILRRDQEKVDEMASILKQRSIDAMLDRHVTEMALEIEAEVARCAALIQQGFNAPITRTRLTDVPGKRFKTIGMGLAEVNQWDARLEAARATIHLLDSDTLPPAGSATTLRTVAKIFAAVGAEDTPDWYSLSRFLGHPSAGHCRSLADAFYGMVYAVEQGQEKAYNDLRGFALDGYAGEMLENYTDLASGGEYLPEPGVAYIAWSSSDPSTLEVGVADESVDDDLYMLNREKNGADRYGLLAVWLVHDVDDARTTIAERLKSHLTDDGGYRMNLGEAKAAIDEALEQTSNTVLSPWHDSTEAVPKKAPAVAVA